MQFCALTMNVDMALELLVDAVYLCVIIQSIDFSMLESFGE